MNSIKLITVSASLAIGALLSSCVRPIQQQQQANPYGQAQTSTENPYGVPQATSNTVGAYPTTSTTQYPSAEAAPGVTEYPSAPATTAYPAVNPSSASGSSYTIQKGDTLFGISRKFGASVDAIQSANGMSGTTIYAGQTLAIPQ